MVLMRKIKENICISTVISYIHYSRWMLGCHSTIRNIKLKLACASIILSHVYVCIVKNASMISKGQEFNYLRSVQCTYVPSTE